MSPVRAFYSLNLLLLITLFMAMKSSHFILCSANGICGQIDFIFRFYYVATMAYENLFLILKI